MVRGQGHDLVGNIQLAPQHVPTKAQSSVASCFGLGGTPTTDLLSQPSGSFSVAHRGLHVASPESHVLPPARHTDKLPTEEVEHDPGLTAQVICQKVLFFLIPTTDDMLSILTPLSQGRGLQSCTHLSQDPRGMSAASEPYATPLISSGCDSILSLLDTRNIIKLYAAIHILFVSRSSEAQYGVSVMRTYYPLSVKRAH